jgi:hypothetical protein
VIVVVRQQQPKDCGVSALASIAPLPYDLVYEAVTAIVPDWRGTLGLHNHQVIAAAAALDLPLTPTRKYDLDAEDRGVLRLYSPVHSAGGHYVAIYRGLIIDPADGSIRPWRDYQRAYDVRFATLLRRDV